MGITQSKLEETYRQLKSKYEGRIEDYFAPLFLEEKHNKPLVDVISNCAFGNNDYGIDAYFIDRDARNLYLYQFKWSHDHLLFKESYERLIKDGIERIFGNPTQDSNLNTTIRKLKYELQEYQSLINKVYICFVFNGDPEKAEKSKTLDSLREELESKKHFIDVFLKSNEITLTIQYISNATKLINQKTRTTKTHVYLIDFKTNLSQQALNGETLHVGLIKLYDLYKILLEMHIRLFEKNIRAGLSADTPPNRSIRKSLKEIVLDKTLSPEYFTFNNNGITIYAEKIDFEDGKAKIVEPRILNGAQTITTFSRFIEENQKHPAIIENDEILKSITVIAKIITNSRPQFITNVTIFNNKQNKVEAWHLRASDLIQCEFEDKFLNELEIFYERQEKAFENLTDEELEELGICQANKEISIKQLAQTFLALQGEIDNMSRLSDVFEDEKLYKKTFKEEYLEADSRSILLAYKIQFRLTPITKKIIAQGERKYNFVKHAKNLIWALLIQALLNDDRNDYLLNNFGHRLTRGIEGNFNEYLKDTASRKIRPILSKLIENDKYIKLIEEEKYSFLRSKVIYQEAMDIAMRKYRWEKLTF